MGRFPIDVLLMVLEALRGLGKVDREVHCYQDGYQQDIHEMFVSRWSETG
jgi:hypothetical protein